MHKIPSGIFLTYFAFIIFPQGCETHTCSLAERLKCHGEYARARFSATHGDAFACGAASDYKKCANNILSDCKANPGAPNASLIISQAKFTINHMKSVQHQHKCIKKVISGAGQRNTSLLAIALGLFCSFLILKSKI